MRAFFYGIVEALGWIALFLLVGFVWREALRAWGLPT